MIDLDQESDGVEFDDNVKIIPSRYSQRVKSFMAEWLMRHKLAKNMEQANLLLVAISIFAIVLAMLILYYGSLYVDLKNNEPELLTPQTSV